MANTSLDTIDHLQRVLEADLIGPFLPPAEDGTTPQETLPMPPSRWYLTGFVAPQGNQETDDPTEEDELGAGDDSNDEEENSTEPEAKQPKRFPASIGLSVFLPAAATRIEVEVSFSQYQALPISISEGKSRTVWRRLPETRTKLQVPLDAVSLGVGIELPGAPSVWLQGELQPTHAPGFPAQTRALALFVVNRRKPAEKGRQDESFLFQAKLSLQCAQGLVPRPNLKDEHTRDDDDRIADLQFRNRVEFAVGHGVATELLFNETKVVIGAQTTWLPSAVVPRVVSNEDVSGVSCGMEDLAALSSGESAKACLKPLVDAYGAWLIAQKQLDVGSQPREEMKLALLARAEEARKRIAAGIECLAQKADVFEAFRAANQAMAMAARRRSPLRYTTAQPSWRLFQLAFLLLNIEGIENENSEDREVVDLIFFPTGGGKTEAYLGVIAFTLVLRRLRGQTRPDKGLGVGVFLRYTLRLLTLDQLGRAATLICALEVLRKKNPDLGPERFSVGLWVGRAATANTLKEAKELLTKYKAKQGSSPCPLTECPWCSRSFAPDSFDLYPSKDKPTALRVNCLSYTCDFNLNKNQDGLPVLFIDEQIYRELPSFLVSTVDKFALLPWRGEIGILFGRATAREGKTFYGPMHPTIPNSAEVLPEGLQPPGLIVQDELHLISGPLGTMVGLYEAAIGTLCSVNQRGPKVIASTATVRRARQQIRSLFGRPAVSIFPPPAIDESETFFARIDHQSQGRSYLGVAAPGRSMKAILLRTYVSLLAAAARQSTSLASKKSSGPDPADPYLTLVGYFNSLRELGGMRRLVEDEVWSRCNRVEERRPEGFSGDHPWFRNRTLQHEPVELTSRESANSISETRRRLGLPFTEKDHVDVLLASNMISVGVDIERLGLMVIAGQPKTTSEYIQASSRVGRDPKKPGLVVTVFNIHKSRDRSHFERFRTYHESFYRFVEVTSVTPFSGPALERGLAGVIVGMTRHLSPVMTPPEAVMSLSSHRDIGEKASAALSSRAGTERDYNAEESDARTSHVQDQARNLLDAWEESMNKSQEGAAQRCYSGLDRDAKGKPLLFTALEESKPKPGTEEAKFCAPTSMREVEASVHLWIDRE